MKRKLIEAIQKDLIVCDNNSCDFKIVPTTGDINEDISMYLNVECPKCGENLLTEEDYINSLKLTKAVNWINKWFSWLTFFIPSKKESTYQVITHNKISIKKVDDTSN